MSATKTHNFPMTTNQEVHNKEMLAKAAIAGGK